MLYRHIYNLMCLPKYNLMCLPKYNLMCLPKYNSLAMAIQLHMLMLNDTL